MRQHRRPAIRRPAATRRGAARGWRGALLVGLAIVSGCAVGRHGLLAGRVTRTTSATVVDVFTLGGWVRTQSFDSGLSLGYHSASYVFPSDGPQSPSQQWRLLSVPLPAGEPYCRASTRVGTSLDIADPQSGFTLGFLRELWRIGPGFGESAVVRFLYDRGNPEHTVLEIRRDPGKEDRR